MLSQKTIQKIEELLKVKGLAEAISAEGEQDIEIGDLSVFSDDELQTLKSNSYKDGKKAGVEMDVDDIKKELGLEFTGKTVKGLIEAHKKKVLEDAKIEPAEKVKELEGKLSTLQATVQQQEKQLADKENEVAGVKTKGELYKHIPKIDGLDADDIFQLMKAKGYDFKLEGETIVPFKNGEKLTDKLTNPLPAKDVVDGFLKEKKLVQEDSTPGGRGGGDNKPPARATRLSEIKKQFESQGKSLLGSEFAEAVSQAAKDNPEFVME